MRKIVISLLCVLTLVGAIGAQAFAADDIKVYVNSQQLTFDVPPAIVEGRSLVPMKTLFEALGAQVEWVAASKTIIATNNDTKIELAIGSTNAIVNGSNITLDVPAQVQNGRTLVPLKFVGESLKCTVNWDGQARVIDIQSSAAAPESITPAAVTTDAAITSDAAVATTPAAVTSDAAVATTPAAVTSDAAVATTPAAVTSDAAVATTGAAIS